MYKVKNKIYADTGRILKYKNKVAYYFEGVDAKDILEVDVTIEDMYIRNNVAIYSGGLLKEVLKSTDYGDLKAKMINKQFSNNDQIAIMLNKDETTEDRVLFEKMQKWRKWSGEVAKKIISLIKK